MKLARRSQQSNDPSGLLRQLQQLLDSFSEKLGGQELREQVKSLVPAFHKLRDLGSSLMPGVTNGMDRVLAYLRAYPRTVVDADELMVVSGIQEWARRLRQLRVEFGWSIMSGGTLRDASDGDDSFAKSFAAEYGIRPERLKPDQYILVTEEQDREAAHRWHVLNTIRKKKLSVKAKIQEYLLQNVGSKVTGEELKYLAKDKKEWARRTRELRTEDGWAVATKQSGRPDLAIGVYLLEHSKQAEPHDRRIPDPVRVAVLGRDHFACQECGWRIEDARQGDRRQYLELHHIVHHKDGGPNNVENLITLCNVHHDEVHRKEHRKGK